jgi:glutamyl-tRNA reductase
MTSVASFIVLGKKLTKTCNRYEVYDFLFTEYMNISIHKDNSRFLMEYRKNLRFMGQDSSVMPTPEAAPKA